jgi:flagellin
MRINTNIAAMNTYTKLNSASTAQAKSLEKLSSGLRINRAGDDAAGLAISEKMRGQVGGLNQAVSNAQDGINLIQTAEGGLNETHAILNRMRDLAVQSANDTNSDDDRLVIQKEVDQLAQEITRIATKTDFNGKKILNGTDGTAIKLQIGANATDEITLAIGKMDASATGLKVEGASATQGLDVSTDAAAASTAITTIDTAIKSVSTERSNLGATQNRLEHTINNLTTTSENLSAAESRIRDVDMAKEMMNFTKNNILNQASTAMLAQANQMPQSVLQLLG